MLNPNARYFAGKKYAVLITVLITVLLASGRVEAASFFFWGGDSSSAVGQVSEIGLFLDAEGEEINAVEGIVSISTDLFEIKDVRNGNSIVSLWLGAPRIENYPEKQRQEVFFSGIIPGGYAGNGGLIFSMDVRALAGGRGVIEIKNARVLLNDGKGTEAQLTTPPYSFRVLSGGVDLSAPLLEDAEPPEPFEPLVVSDENVFDGKDFLVFTTQDKGSGIDHYEVREGDDQFMRAESPHLLSDQGVEEGITVKAVDKNGNERVATLPPESQVAWYERYWMIIVMMSVAFTSVFLIFTKRPSSR